MSKPSRRPHTEATPSAFVLEAEALRALAHPKRLMILSRLDDRGATVTELASALHLTMPNASQHLRVLRDRGIVRAERTGQVARYRLTNPAFRSCCALVRQLVIDEARRRGEGLWLPIDTPNPEEGSGTAPA